MPVDSEPRIKPAPLFLADRDDWTLHADYDLIVADRLKSAYQHINARPHHVPVGGLDPFARAANLALSCLDLKMCECQRLRVLYVLAQAYAAQDNEHEALWWIGEAINQTQHVPDHLSFIELLDLRAHCNNRRLEFRAASADLETIVARLRAEQQPWDQGTVTRMIATLESDAMVRFYLADLDRMGTLLRAARSLEPQAKEPVMWVARIGLAQAYLSRQLGNATEAAGLALRSATFFDAHNESHSAVRARVLLAAAHVDIAKRLLADDEQKSHLILAGSHLHAAQQLTRGRADENGSALVTLERVRLDRLRGAERTRLPAIERVIADAHSEGNTILLAQALTTLGDEYRALGETNSAKHAYCEVLRALGDHEITLIAQPARRALQELGA